jgi:hypothetical protein
VALAASAAAGLALAVLPLVSQLGPESALLLGLALPPLVAFASARLVARARGTAATGVALLAGALALALGCVALPVALVLGASVARGACDPLGGLGFALLGPLPGAALAALVGLWAGALLPGRGRAAAWLAALVPLAEDALALARFHASPAIFAYGHGFGWFPGTLYDEGTQFGPPLLALRAGTLGLGAALAALFAVLYRPGAGRLVLRRAQLARLGRAPSAALVAALGLAAFAYVEASAESLGIRSSPASIAQRLGSSVRAGRCTAVVPRELPQDEARRLADDCAFRLWRMERALGVRSAAPITAFFFRDASEKRALMGAADTYIAKPWRREVYLQLAEWPHAVLEHEVAHVVAGEHARGPFRVGGRLGGWLPDAGMIEGVAVAAAWKARDGRTPHEWARALLDLGLAPSPTRTAGLAFLLEPASRAYTVHGSFWRYVLDEHGPEVVARAYATGDLAAASGVPLARLEEGWRRALARLPADDELRALARARFERGGLFARPCPHVTARLRQRLGADLASGDAGGAAETCRALLAVDPADLGARVALVSALASTGEAAAADVELHSLSTRWRAPSSIVTLAREAIADGAWRAGRVEDARAAYAALALEPRLEDARRVLEVKRLALDASPEVERALRDLLVGRVGPDPALAVHLARVVRDGRADGLGAYLEARQLAARLHHGRALPLLQDALERGLPHPLLVAEARRMILRSAYAAGEFAVVDRVAGEILGSDATASPARAHEREEALEWRERVAWQRARDDAAAE